jgi:hypothetical protein
VRPIRNLDWDRNLARDRNLDRHDRFRRHELPKKVPTSQFVAARMATSVGQL